MKQKTTQRGFSYYDFRDANGAYCSLQESSAVRFEDEDGGIPDTLIWLGIDRERDGFVPGKEVSNYEGNMVKLGARMHLTQSQVRELLPLLSYFVEHGELPSLNDQA